MASALTLADLFNAEAAEAPYQRLVDVLNRQTARLELALTRLETLELAQATTSAACDQLQSQQLPSLQTRLQELEDQIQHRCDRYERQCIAGLTRLENALADKADKDEMGEELARVDRATIKLGHEFRAEAVSFELVNSLQVDQSLLHERLATMDHRLEGKMDKTEASRMDATLTQIREFRPVATQLAARLTNIESSQTTLKQASAGWDELLAAHTANLVELTERIQTISSTTTEWRREHDQVVMPQLTVASEGVKQIDRELQQRASDAATLESAVRTLSAKFHAATATTSDSLRQLWASVESGSHARSSLQQQLTHWRDESSSAAELRATQTDLADLIERVKQLAAECDTLVEHSAISSRFLDWFATRGEAYEHNLQLVETQLGRLAQVSQPRFREPFNGRVRFPRSP